MRRFACLLVSSLLALCCGTALAQSSGEPVPNGRLPTWAVPERYSLALKIDPEQTQFSGRTTIRVQLKQASDHLWLHGKELQVSKVTVKPGKGKALTAGYVEADAQTGVARLDFGRTLKPQTLTVEIAYSAPLNQQLQGLYQVKYQGKAYAMTQMEPISARYAFPGFDEPAFKTPFNLSLTVPSHDQALANTIAISTKPAGKGWKTVTFAPTVPLPTYLVAYAAGPWDVVDVAPMPATPQRPNATPLRGIAAKGQGPRITPALDQTPAIIAALEDYYAFGYPFDKLDLVAAPDFSAGAMENPGFVTFRDWLLLLDKDSPAENVQRSFNVNAHELAHQWTGDAVTMEWWDDLWLNEAFATWMQQKITMQLHPEYNANLDRISGAQHAMENDSLVSARKIRQPITGNGDIETAFDGITYQKGAAVLAMFEAFVGEDVFREGMRAYIAKHTFGNATADDLVDAIAEAAGKGNDFKAAFRSFLNQPGVPYLQTEVAREGGKTVVKLQQQRYLPLGSTGSTAQQWGVPVCVKYGKGEKQVGTACKLLEDGSGSIVLEGAGKNTWVFPNARGAGYYRFSLPKKQLAALAGRSASWTITNSSPTPMRSMRRTVTAMLTTRLCSRRSRSWRRRNRPMSLPRWWIASCGSGATRPPPRRSAAHCARLPNRRICRVCVHWVTRGAAASRSTTPHCVRRWPACSRCVCRTQRYARHCSHKAMRYWLAATAHWISPPLTRTCWAPRWQ